MSTPADQNGDISPEDDLSGRQLGDYRLLRRLGSGAMAVVYLAEQSSLKRQVAFKVLRGEFVDDETYVRRFNREAEAAAALVHANIVQIHEIGRIGRVYFIAQEYVQGQNLRSWITRNEKPSLPLVLSIMCQVSAALAKAGTRGIVHRDIKPENILLTHSGEVKVADFGLARLPSQGDPVELTQVGVTLGTPLYMSPEQVEGKPLDPRSDIYSFGVTCYHMIAGSPPFTGQTPLSVAVQHLKKEPEPLENLRSDLPRELYEIVHRMLAKDPRQRYQSATQLIQDLRRLQQDHLHNEWPDGLPGWDTTNVDVASFEPVQATQRLQAVMNSTASAPSRRRQVGLALAFVGVFLVAATSAWFLTDKKPLVTPAAANARVATKENVLLQYLQATRLNTPEAWQAVVDFNPPDPNFVPRAKQQLIRIYLGNSDYDSALVLCNELIALDPMEVELRAFGLAGRAVALTGKGEYSESAKAVAEFDPLGDKLDDRTMLQLLVWAKEKNARALSANTHSPSG
ncbi:MAG: serine/threonine protein kinase [Pirellulales bacterium]|nr:serine/threonine protein kinase [Pirellulales bacterium]